MAGAAVTSPRPGIGDIVGMNQPWPLVMGIVNVTPDSFHDGDRHADAQAAIAHGRALAAAGAAILDVGGESTRPGADPVGETAELSRVIPVIAALAGDGHVVSIDTRNATVMENAVNAGARMINDVSALSHDPQSLATATRANVAVVLMHSRGTPADMQSQVDYDDLISDVLAALTARIEACLGAGMDRAQLIIDPGLGFAKTAPQSAALLANMARFHALGCPVLIGASRKSFIGALTAAAGIAATDGSNDRLPGSLAAALWAAERGAAILRVHDVKETVQALAIFRALCYKESHRQ